MHTNNAARNKRNKHGRKGVPRALRNLPLAEAQSIELKQKAFRSGYEAGQRRALQLASTTVNVSKTIRAARKALDDLITDVVG